MTASPHNLPAVLGTAGPCSLGRWRGAPRTPVPEGLRACRMPTSCAYHPINWAEMNHWSSMGGVACSSVTKQLNG
jgi:hypothetical protein